MLIVNKSYRGAVWAAVLGYGLLLPLAAQAQTMPAGTQVPLEFAQTLSSKTAHKGDRVDFRVASDVVVDGKVLIPAGAAAEGTIESMNRPRNFGQHAKMKIRLVRVRTTDGEFVALEPYTSGRRLSSKGPGAAGAGLLVLGPVGVAAGAFVKGRDLTIKEGTRIEAQVAGY